MLDGCYGVTKALVVTSGWLPGLCFVVPGCPGWLLCVSGYYTVAKVFWVVARVLSGSSKWLQWRSK